MYLDYSKMGFDGDGRPEIPVLILETLGGDTIGPLSNVVDLTMHVKFAEPSEITFTLPAYSDGMKTPFYDDVSGYKVIRTEHYGVYLIWKPSTSGDGVSESKQVTCYSIEKELELKRFFLEEGTFNFWNQVSPDDTVLGRCMECAPGWSIGYVSPSLVGRYRTFDQYDDALLSFLYDTAPEKYRCVVVFDPYKKTVNAYDVDEERPVLPIYLGYDNLLQDAEIEEMSDELVTAMRPYGADELDIRNVNPIGTNWIYDLSYFISNGDIPDTLAQKWTTWQTRIASTQEYYRGLVALQASASARLISEQAAMTDLEGELENLINQQSVTIQALAMEETDAGRQSQQELLDEINEKIAAKKEEISRQEDVIESVQNMLDPDNEASYTAQILAVNSELAITSFFSNDEYAVLSKYFIEQDITENTFVATDVNTTVTGDSGQLSDVIVSLTEALITRIDMEEQFGCTMYTLAGGSVSIHGDDAIVGDVIRGTLETREGGTFVCSLYMGSMKVGTNASPSGTITISGSLHGFSDDIVKKDEDGIVTYEGTSISFTIDSASLFVTTNVSDYQKYSVQMELYEYASDLLHDLATPTYEFSIEAGNFLFTHEFDLFRNTLSLGSGIYLKLRDGEVITPIIIEFEVEFEEREKISLIFSNRFKRKDNVNTLKDMIESSYSTSRSFDASKYIYNQAAAQASQVSQFMNGSLDAAVNTIIASKNQSVVINGAGIQIGGDSPYQIRIVDRMIAFTDDNWSTSKMALGLFASSEVGQYFGINAEVVGGRLIVGNNLIIENQNDQGVMQFKVDATGVWLNNAVFVLQSDTLQGGGKMILDPKYGLVAGTGNLFITEGTTVTPSFIDEDGSILKDDDGMPENANFYIDIRDGSAYFRGTVNAVSGSIGGWILEDDRLYSGSGNTYVALNASGSEDSLYAIWAGSKNPTSAKFSVKRDGSLYARDGLFSGTLSASQVDGVLAAVGDDSWIEGCGIRVGENPFSPTGYNFYVDTSGNVTIGGSLSMAGTSNWLQVRYSSDRNATIPDGWNEAWNVLWDNTDTQVWAIYSYNGGSDWTQPMLVQGKDGERGPQGSPGSDANVPAWVQAYTASAEFDTLVTNEWVVSMNLYGSKIYGANYYSEDAQTSFDLLNMDDVSVGIGGGFALEDTSWQILQVRRSGGLTVYWDSMNNRFLGTHTTGVMAMGTWDFTPATVTGLYMEFAP